MIKKVWYSRGIFMCYCDSVGRCEKAFHTCHCRTPQQERVRLKNAAPSFGLVIAFTLQTPFEGCGLPWPFYDTPMGQERYGTQRGAYNRNRKKILATQSVCYLCGQPIDPTLKFPHPYSATIDHVIPISQDGDKTDIDNMRAAHFRCNRLKGNKMPDELLAEKQKEVGNFDLPLSLDWESYRSESK